jgi:hypothetical protein
MGTSSHSSRRIVREELKVQGTDAQDAEGWSSAVTRLPAPGEQVQCAEGMAQVVRILGRTGDGSRLLELTLPDRPNKPFFAAASNVLVRPEPA